MANLHAIQEILDDPSIKCKVAKDVRWLSHDMAIKVVIRTLPSLLVSLHREASQKQRANFTWAVEVYEKLQICSLFLPAIRCIATPQPPF